MVGRALEQAHGALAPHIGASALTFDVLPDGLRAAGEHTDPTGQASRSLASKLHARGVAHLYLGPSMDASGLQHLVELLSTDVEILAEMGGIRSQLEQRDAAGINVDLLQLDKLFDGEAAGADPTMAVWESLVSGWGESGNRDILDHELLAADSERFADFLDWLLDDDSPPAQASELSRLELVRTVCKGIGAAAAGLGPDRVDAAANVVSSRYDALDKEIWIDILGPSPEDGTSDATAPGATGPPRGDEAGRGATALADLTRAIGASLSREQVEELLTYTLASRERASPRIHGLFHDLLEGRDERDEMEHAIREAVQRQTNTANDRASFEELWPRLTETFHGEHLESFVSTTYRAELDQLLASSPAACLWDLQRIGPRFRELEPSYLVRRKAKVILEILDANNDDEEYASLIAKLERSLPELIADGQYIATEEVLKKLAADLIPSSGLSNAQRGNARDMLVRLCNQHTLREVVRNLAGRSTAQIDAAGRIFNSLGPMAVPALLEALSQEQSRPVRVHLVRMLAAMGDQALPEISKHLRDKRWFFVRNLLWIVGEIGDPGFAPHLGIIVKHPDVGVRREAVRSLARLRNEAAAKALVSASEDSDLEVRLLAIHGLGTSRALSAIPHLRELISLPNLSGKNTEIIRAAAVALGRLGAGEAQDALVQLARRPWLFRRRRAAASDAAAWAVAALRGEATDEAPEARLGRAGDMPSPSRITGFAPTPSRGGGAAFPSKPAGDNPSDPAGD